MELVIATTNKGKLREIRALLADLPVHVTSLADYPGAPEVIEDGKSFRANALKKASEIALFTGKLTMGEDSGLQVQALGNAPGIYSARYSGPTATDKKNNAKLLRDLRGVPTVRRQACYRCCAALVDGKNQAVVAEVGARCGGLITDRARGSNGFGYDPYFLIPRYNQTFGELDPSIKARISHRARAMQKIRRVLIATIHPE